MKLFFMHKTNLQQKYISSKAATNNYLDNRFIDFFDKYLIFSNFIDNTHYSRSCPMLYLKQTC